MRHVPEQRVGVSAGVDPDTVLAQQVQAHDRADRVGGQRLPRLSRYPLRQEAGHVTGVLGGLLTHRSDDDVEVMVPGEHGQPVRLIGVHAQAGPPHGAPGMLLLRDADPVQ